MVEREQKGKEGRRMQPYCVSWWDLDSGGTGLAVSPKAMLQALVTTPASSNPIQSFPLVK